MPGILCSDKREEIRERRENERDKKILSLCRFDLCIYYSNLNRAV